MSASARRILRYKAAYALALRDTDRMNTVWIGLTLRRLFNAMQENA